MYVEASNARAEPEVTSYEVRPAPAIATRITNKVEYFDAVDGE